MDDPSCLRILVATDNHLGYGEKDPIRGQDSFDAFEEILKYARDLQVDMMVLGGDLFHDNKPSRKCLHSAMELLRHYCIGERECALEFLSDPSVNFHSRFGSANYLDGNYNVSLPVFAIHGNHDDPAGDGGLSSLDLLSTAGLINYFGKAKEVDDITVSPIILRKGTTHLALYGLGNIRDERLHRTFTSNKVRMLRPAALQDADPDNWFNLMLFHQNRAAHSPKNHIPEVFLDDFLDLIIWGHEHDCQIDPLYYPQRDFYVCQPGSSCITSLSDGESIRKHVGLLTVKGNQFKMEPLPLRSIRPFSFADLQLTVTDQKSVQAAIQNKVEQMIANCVQQWLDDNPDAERAPPLPLIRLRIDHSSSSISSMVNPQRFGQAYSDRVANPRDIIHLIRRKLASSSAASGASSSNHKINMPEQSSSCKRVEDLVDEFLKCQRLDLLPQNEFSDVVKIFVEKDDKDAIDSFLKTSLQRTIGQLKEKHQLESLRVEIDRVRLGREEEWRLLNPDGSAVINHRVSPNSSASASHAESQIENIENTEHSVPAPKSIRGGRQKRPTPLQISTTIPPDVVKETPTKKSRWPTKK